MDIKPKNELQCEKTYLSMWAPRKTQISLHKCAVIVILMKKLCILGYTKCDKQWFWSDLFVLGFYGPVNPMGSCRARSVYLTTFTGQA